MCLYRTKFISTMKVKARFLIFVLLTNSIRNGTGFKCLSGYKMTQENEEKLEEFYEQDCITEDGEDRCYSAKGSLIVQKIACELFKTTVYLKVLFKCYSNITHICYVYLYQFEFRNKKLL